MFAGHIKVLGGPHVARGPDVAQAWSKLRKFGLGNVRPAGHMRPAEHLNVAREHFLDW